MKCIFKIQFWLNFIKQKLKVKHALICKAFPYIFLYEKIYITYMIIFILVIFMNEDDTGTYTIKAVDDPRTLNKILHLRPGTEHTLTKRAHCTLGIENRQELRAGLCSR